MILLEQATNSITGIAITSDKLTYNLDNTMGSRWTFGGLLGI
jgi:hypothetical protein